MDSTIQPLLVGSENGGTDLTVFVGEGGTSYELYLGLGLVERVSVDPAAFHRKLLVARLQNAGRPVRELARKFGHDPRTMRNWGKALRSGDMVELVRCRNGDVHRVCPQRPLPTSRGRVRDPRFAANPFAEAFALLAHRCRSVRGQPRTPPGRPVSPAPSCTDAGARTPKEHVPALRDALPGAIPLFSPLATPRPKAW